VNALSILRCLGGVVGLYLVLGVVLTLLGRLSREEPLRVWISCILTLPLVCVILQVQTWREGEKQ
jgi:hypothetical protein